MGGGLAAALTTLGVLLCLLVIAGRLLYSHGYYRLHPWVHHPLVFAVLAMAAFAGACALGITRPMPRWLGTIGFALAGLCLVGLGWFVSVFDDDLTEVSRRPSPDGRMELTVREGHNWIDPFYRLGVRTMSGILSREYDLGCVNGDFLSLNDFGWAGPQTVRVQLSNGQTTVINLAGGGRPDRTVDGGC